MASPIEMMVKQAMRGLGLEPETIMEKVQELQALFLAGYKHAEQANRRLARIEAHLGLSDIEPVSVVELITHENPVSRADDVTSGNGGGR